MTTKGKKKVADFATLAEAFLELELEEFGEPAQGDAKTWRRQIIRVVGASRVNRERLGVLLVHGRKHFKKDRVWLRVKESVAKAAGYRSPRSIETLMDDALRARSLRNVSPNRYQALERYGVVAAETRWAKLIDEASKNVPENETPESALQAIEKLYEKFAPPKRSKSASAGTPIERLSGKIEKLVVQLFGNLPKDQRESVIEKIVAEAANKADEAEIQKSAAASTQEQHTVDSQQLLVMTKNGKDENAPIGHSNPPATAIPLQGPPQPWGDAYLGSLIPGARILEPVEFSNEGLHIAEGDKLPKRFFVGDIFFSGLSDFIPKHHLEFFGKVDRHRYLVLTTNVHRVLEICNQADAPELPGNLWIGARIGSCSEFDQIEALGTLKTPNKFVALLPFVTDKPIRESSPAFEDILRRAGIRWVIFGGDHRYRWSLAEDDEKEIARASHAAGCPVYCTSIQTADDLMRGGQVDPKSVPGIFYNGTHSRKIWKLRELPAFTHTPLPLSA